MLVLGRTEGESILIDGGIVIKVVRVRGGGVRLGITAPGSTKIWRSEIELPKASESSPASSPAGPAGDNGSSADLIS